MRRGRGGVRSAKRKSEEEEGRGGVRSARRKREEGGSEVYGFPVKVITFIENVIL